MKTKVATVLSLVGVLSAGSAAALVNTQILDSGPSSSGASAAVLPPASTVKLTVPAASVSTSTSTTVATTLPASPTTVAPTTVATTIPATTAAPATGFLTAYTVGEAGTVTVDVIGGRLVLVNAVPTPGWTVQEAEEDSDDNEVEVKFASPTTLVEFKVAFVDGQLVTSIESEALAGAPSATPPSNTVTSTTIDDDDDDDADDDDDGDDNSGRDGDDDDDNDDDDDDFDDDDDDDNSGSGSGSGGDDDDDDD